jgi:leucyl-tRNA synthetase
MLNNLEKEVVSKNDLELVLKIMHPFTPHICQELWEKLGNNSYIDFESWPVYDPKFSDEDINLIVQINGKTREILKVKKGISQNDALNLALNSKKIKDLLGDKNYKKIIYIQDKVLNILI